MPTLEDLLKEAAELQGGYIDLHFSNGTWDCGVNLDGSFQTQHRTGDWDWDTHPATNEPTAEAAVIKLLENLRAREKGKE